MNLAIEHKNNHSQIKFKLAIFMQFHVKFNYCHIKIKRYLPVK